MDLTFRLGWRSPTSHGKSAMTIDPDGARSATPGKRAKISLKTAGFVGCWRWESSAKAPHARSGGSSDHRGMQEIALRARRQRVERPAGREHQSISVAQGI